MPVSTSDVQIARKKMKNIRMRVLPSGEVVVSAPFRTPVSKIHEFIDAHSDWIAAQKSKLLQKPSAQLISRAEFEAKCTEFIDYWCHQIGVEYARLRYRKMTSRWGVCNTTTRIITLNTELMKYPMECAEYVCLHEVSHLLHRNHSKAFWEVVESQMVDYKHWRQVLR